MKLWLLHHAVETYAIGRRASSRWGMLLGADSESSDPCLMLLGGNAKVLAVVVTCFARSRPTPERIGPHHLLPLGLRVSARPPGREFMGRASALTRRRNEDGIHQWLQATSSSLRDNGRENSQPLKFKLGAEVCASTVWRSRSICAGGPPLRISRHQDAAHDSERNRYAAEARTWGARLSR